MEIALQTARALAMSLELPEKFFTNNMTEPVAQMVLLRYPALAAATSSSQAAAPVAQACGAHTDCGFLTLLVQDQSKDGGLQILNNSGVWIDAPQKEVRKRYFINSLYYICLSIDIYYLFVQFCFDRLVLTL